MTRIGACFLSLSFFLTWIVCDPKIACHQCHLSLSTTWPITYVDIENEEITPHDNHHEVDQQTITGHLPAVGPSSGPDVDKAWTAWDGECGLCWSVWLKHLRTSLSLSLWSSGTCPQHDRSQSAALPACLCPGGIVEEEEAIYLEFCRWRTVASINSCDTASDCHKMSPRPRVLDCCRWTRGCKKAMWREMTAAQH